MKTEQTAGDVAREVLRRRVGASASVAVGLSGGMDSVALLDALAGAGLEGGALSACHVHHGVSANADEWARFCGEVCAARSVPLSVFRAKAAGRRPTEEALREMRLRAFARMKVDFVALAHHADDQNETALFRLLRGTGLAGLAAMREVAPLQGMRKVFVLRPFLRVPRADILAYAKERRLEWVEDEDNLNLARKRNFLRRKLLPLAGREFPNARKAPGAVATRLAESADLLRELAELDGDCASGSEAGEGWALEALRELGAERVANLLHSELTEMGAPPPERATREAARQIVSARPGARMAFAFGRHRLVARGGRLVWAGENILRQIRGNSRKSGKIRGKETPKNDSL